MKVNEAAAAVASSPEPRLLFRTRAGYAWLWAAVAALACIAMLLRVYGLQERVFWTDEAITAMRVAGFTGREFVAGVYDGRLHTAGELQNYAGKGSVRPASAVVRSLADEDAQHPPAYYLATYYWTRVAGHSIAALRTVSTIAGILTPFAIGWLCFELFGEGLAAFLGFALAAVSPVLVVYSHQAREYALWALITALASAVLVRASRSSGYAWWILYTIAAIAGAYTDGFFAFVLAGHAVYAVAQIRGRGLATFVASIAIVFCAVLPWIWIVVHQTRVIASTNGWTATPWPLVMLAEKWAFNLGATFFDLEFSRMAFASLFVIVLAFEAYAVAWTWLRAPLAARWMTFALVVPATLFLAVPDLVLHAHRSTVTRYDMPVYVGLLACAAGCLSHGILTSRRRFTWAAVAGTLFCIALASSIVDSRMSVWWDNHEDGPDPAMAAVVNASEKPLLLARGSWPRLLDLTFYLREGVVVRAGNTTVRPVPGFTDVFVFGRPNDAAAFTRVLGAGSLYPAYTVQGNEQLRRFRASSKTLDPDSMSLWRVNDARNTR
ncbi:MAG: glycosyltransferase family 39 protein [Vulcanimicrobiaceae bacterium]